MSISEVKAVALDRHPDCAYVEVYNGMAFPFTLTWVAKLWRNEECYLAGDPPKYVEESFPCDGDFQELYREHEGR